MSRAQVGRFSLRSSLHAWLGCLWLPKSACNFVNSQTPGESSGGDPVWDQISLLNMFVTVTH